MIVCIGHTAISIERGQYSAELRNKMVKKIDQVPLVDTVLHDPGAGNVNKIGSGCEFLRSIYRRPIDRTIRGKLVAEQIKIRPQILQNENERTLRHTIGLEILLSRTNGGCADDERG